MNDLDNFRYLSIKQKTQVLEAEGRFICSLVSHGLKISLYCYCRQYVEVFNEAENNKLVGVRILEDKKRLRFYARNLDIRFLLGQSLLCFVFIMNTTHEEFFKMAS